jgi:hypothetical protein
MVLLSLIKKKIWSQDGNGSRQGAVGTSGGSKSVSTVLVQQLHGRDWNAVVTRLATHPSEAKTWTKVELDNVGTNDNTTNNNINNNTNRRRSSGQEQENSDDDGPQNGEAQAGASQPQQQQRHVRQALSQSQERRRESTTRTTSSNTHNNCHKDSSAICKVLPLHVALIEGAPLNVIQALLKANPVSIIARDGRYNRYPLHFACLYDPRLDVIEYLVQKDKSACRHPDVLNRTVLHYAAFGKAEVEIFDCLLQEYPKAVIFQDMLQWLPLHVAARMSCRFDVLKRLVEVYPSALIRETRRGSTPIGIATRFFGAGSVMESQLCCLQAAVETIYDTTHSRLSLQMVSSDYWEERSDGPQPLSLGAGHMSSNSNGNDLTAANDGLDQEADEDETEQDQDDDDEVAEGSGRFEDKPGLRSSECSSICEEDELNASQMATQKQQPDAPTCDDLDDDSNMCVVCLQEERTHAFVPCGHLCVCVECSVLSHRQAGGLKCPLCRKKSFLVMKVFA